MNKNFTEELVSLLKNKAQCIWVKTYEETEVIKAIKSIINNNFSSMNLYTWSFFSGIKKENLSPFEKENPSNPGIGPDQLLETIIKKQNTGKKVKNSNGKTEVIDKDENIFILKDFHCNLKDAGINRAIRDAKEGNNFLSYNPIIIISPIVNIPVEEDKLFTILDFETPDDEEIRKILMALKEKVLKSIESSNDHNYFLPDNIDDIIEECVKHARGLTKNQIMFYATKSLIDYKTISTKIFKEARLNLIKQTGILEYKEPSGCLEQMGGNEAFKKWIEEIKYTFTPEAEEFGVQKSKGYLALGIPGTSKSVSAEITANLLHLPLLEFKMQNIMNSLVGKSEQNMADAVKIIKSCSPCVLFIDEVEKSLSGNSSSDRTDGGTLSRVLGQLLTFLASDDSKNVFTIMTSNDVSKLPPELTRSGRLDVIWYFGLPNELERKEIFNIYLKDTKLDINDNLLNYAVKETNSYTGAEIKQIVNVLVRRLFFKIKEKNDSTIDKEDILLAIKEVIPVAISSREKILALDTYCKNRARYANEIEDQVEEYDEDNDNEIDYDNIFD